MSLHIIIFIVIRYYFYCSNIFLISIFKRQYQNSLFYSTIPLFSHNHFRLNVIHILNHFLIFWHFLHFYFKSLFANHFYQFQRSLSLPLLQVSNLQFSYFICLISLYTPFINVMELLIYTVFKFLNQHYKR